VFRQRRFSDLSRAEERHRGRLRKARPDGVFQPLTGNHMLLFLSQK
jgi:hypothetical protein